MNKVKVKHCTNARFQPNQHAFLSEKSRENTWYVGNLYDVRVLKTNINCQGTVHACPCAMHHTCIMIACLDHEFMYFS